MGKLAENKRAKRIALLDSAYALFLEKGEHDTTISDIVDRSGLGKGTFYLYFTDKVDIRKKLIAYESRKILVSAFRALSTQSLTGLEQQVTFLADQIIADLSARPELLELLSRNLGWGLLRDEFTAELDLEFEEAFHRLTAPHGLTRERSELLLFLLVELIGSTLYSPILCGQPCTIEEFRPHLLDSICCLVSRFVPIPAH